MTPSSVAVVIPNLDGAALLGPCLESLKSQSVVPAEVMLVDNVSQDDSVEVATRAFPEIRVIHNNENRGYAGACAQGCAQTVSDYILLLNNDVELQSGTLAGLVAVLDGNANIGACQPLTVAENGRAEGAGSFFTKTGFLRHVDEDELASDTPQERFALNGACLLIRRLAYSDAGELDPSFFAYFEESDLCWRMHLAGWHLVIVPSCSALHRVGATTRRIFDSSFVDYLSFRNRITSIRRNCERPLRYRVLAVHVVLCLVTAFAFVVSGKPRNGMGIAKALWWHVLHSRKVTADRARYYTFRRHGDSIIDDLVVTTDWAGAWMLMKRYLVRW